MQKRGFMQPSLCRVTHSYPSPVISCIHKEPRATECQAVNEEEIFAIQNEESLFPVGWIH
nr:hypothetical protein [Tanacetum cinerariifolium]